MFRTVIKLKAVTGTCGNFWGSQELSGAKKTKNNNTPLSTNFDSKLL